MDTIEVYNVQTLAGTERLRAKLEYNLSPRHLNPRSTPSSTATSLPKVLISIVVVFCPWISLHCRGLQDLFSFDLGTLQFAFRFTGIINLKHLRTHRDETQLLLIAVHPPAQSSRFIISASSSITRALI
jgi:hypothetical protein